MQKTSDLFINNSILYRCTQKYYDRRLAKYNIGYGQILFLMMINENEGVTMKQLTQMGSFDKGTTTKGISKLESIGYVRMEVDAKDKRSKHIYTTEKAKDIISMMYIIRKDWWAHITRGMSIAEGDQFTALLDQAVKNALTDIEMANDVHFYGIQKLTLLDYPGKVAATLFTGGCNFKCPFCQNSDLVFLPEHTMEIPIEDIRSFLAKRAKVLEGICISGGEPLLQSGLKNFLETVKSYGYSIKIDTNGSFPERLKDIVEAGLCDYVAVDIKNQPRKYAKTIGIDHYDLEKVKETVAYLLENHVDYEFRTTVVKEFHTATDMKKLGEWIRGAKHYYIQNYRDSDHVIQAGLHGFTVDELKHFKAIVSPYVEHCELRGVDQ